MGGRHSITWSGRNCTAEFRVSAATDRGTVRKVNEDAFVAAPPVFLVADGMGGYAFGDRASRAVADTIGELAETLETVTADSILSLFETAHAQVHALAGDEIAGTTAAGVALIDAADGPKWMVFNIGDSRVYRWTAKGVTQITVDHSVVQELVDDGLIAASDAARHPERNVVTRALGVGDDSTPDVWILPAGGSARFLLCSDGLTKELDDRTIEELLDRSEDDPAGTLVAGALAAGGLDNVTVLVVDADVSVESTATEHLEETLPRT